ncbi:MAG: hypothetical protein KF767_09290 [Bdellovibrionaceae bacterium]|nr:hypothetical protein [Pseudobdellovibrionaceae bacterium]
MAKRILIFLMTLALPMTSVAQPAATAAPSGVAATSSTAVAKTPPPILTVRAVGQVGDQILTSRDVILSGVIEQWLYAIQDRPSETLRRAEKESWFLSLESPSFRDQVSRVMIDLMINLEAENFAVAEVNQLDLQKYSTRLMIDFAIVPQWKQWAPEIGEVQLILKRKLRSRAFLEFKSEGSSQMVSDDEAKAYFEANRAKFGPYPFDQFKKSIKEVLARDKTDQKLKEWFEVLKKKYRVRFLGAPQEGGF